MLLLEKPLLRKKHAVDAVLDTLYWHPGARSSAPRFGQRPGAPRGLVVLLPELESAVTARPGFCFFVLKKFKRPHIST